MIYQLPTKGTQPYRGKYPQRLRSFSHRQGVVHIELNNGERYVATVPDFQPGFNASYTGSANITTKTLYDCFGTEFAVYDMPIEAYAGVLMLNRLARVARYAEGSALLDIPTYLATGKMNAR